MITLGCTKALGDQIGIKKLQPYENQFPSIKSWHAGFKYINRRKCILFTNDTTLYSVFLYGVKKKELSDIKNTFMKYLSESLINEGIELSKSINFIDLKNDNLEILKTHDRSVLGSMNDYWRLIPYYCEMDKYIETGVENSIFPRKLNKEINRTPMQCSKNGFYPIKKLQEHIGVK